MEKLRAIQETNKIINERIDRIKQSFSEDRISLFDGDLFCDTVHEGHNNETSYSICRFETGQKSENINEVEFKRIVCLKGKIIIFIPLFNEEIIMTSPNSILIPPNTKYSIEVMENCELMGIYKPKKRVEDKNLIEERIYTKETKINYE
jgi:hypothetical protein